MSLEALVCVLPVIALVFQGQERRPPAPRAGPPCAGSFRLDFEAEDDFSTPLANGQDISTPPEFGIEVSISGGGPNAGAAIFDSTVGGPNDPSQDLDLLVGLGNLLILQNDQVSMQTVNGIFDKPNDDQNGGSLSFVFTIALRPLSIDLVDIDSGSTQGVVVTLTDAVGNTRTYTIPADWTGDIRQGEPGVETLDLTTLLPQPGWNSVATAVEDAGYDPHAVVAMVVELMSSGAVDNLVLCPCPPLPNPSNPLAAGPHGVGRLADFNAMNAVVAGSVDFPEIPPVVLEQDGAESSVAGGWNGTGQDGMPGFDLSGRIKYPAMGAGGLNAPVAAGGPFPVLVIAHGNHNRFVPPVPPAARVDPRDENYRGYGYLQDLLAMHGFISVSIDLDDFTDLDPGILARAWLVLCHIERMEGLNTMAGPLMGQIDLSRIGLMGHSRGGDAVVQAQRMNATMAGAAADRGPAVGPGPGEGAWPIRAVWSLAATRFFDGMFNWDRIFTPIVDPQKDLVAESVLSGAVPFLGMWGDADGDVNGDDSGVLLAFHVEGIYDGSLPGPKQFVWIEGANHNFWNESWFEGGLGGVFGDDGGPPRRPANLVATRITHRQQQNLAAGYGLAFFRGYILGETAMRDYFRFAANEVPLLTTALPPFPIAAGRVHLQYQALSSQRRVVDDFESNDALGTTSAGQAGVATATLVNPDEIELIGARVHAPAATQSWYHKTRGILFEWDQATDFYETVVPAGQRDVSGFEVLSFRIAQDRRHAASNAEPIVGVMLCNGACDGVGAGPPATVNTDLVTNIPVHQNRTDDALLTKSMLKTIRIPLCRFLEANPALDLKNVEKIRFVFSSRATGQASIDDIEFSQ